MTPKSIETGRILDAQTSAVDVADGTIVSVAQADAARVACAVSLGRDFLGGDFDIVVIGVMRNGAVVPLTALTNGHPACYLSVDKIGTLVMEQLWASNGGSAIATLGVSTVRQIQPLE